MLIRTDSSDVRFRKLIEDLDAYLARINGEKNEFFKNLNHVPEIRNVVLAIENNTAVACGAFKPFDARTVEIKRMFVAPDYRKNGLAKKVLGELEAWALELGFTTSILETAKTMTPAVAFYKNAGYEQILAFGPYIGVETSVCFAKPLK